MTAVRHPVVVVSHGPGPLWLLTKGYEGVNRQTLPARTLTGLFAKLYPNDKNQPKRILFVSAHFDSRRNGFEISSSASPDMFYDYYGFPDESYQVKYPAKGDPAFAQKADIPIVTMSINSLLDSKAHFNLGKAIAPFRDEDTLIFCSGQSTHNLHGVRDLNHPIVDWAAAFQDWLDDTFTPRSTLTYEQRVEQVVNWQAAPGATLAHPTTDHFLPFVVAAGAGMNAEDTGAESFFGGWGAGHLTFANYAWGLRQ
ncbi:UDP-N-acetylglucosamine--peptide N-acetylglucosaminyltransferase SEC [Phytophthora cinnamomi]|uniref:UDP-N-acetylglucosamine--peptide N-acetylglucosaminyltransferase SEC n=1 Tax=Phytophthora cinnamomi TaxID=4785 RepID=UPI00355A113B|nr:UDP-N-acetylglucosamine--peptide N-acetylglucosaminyltransferase SEC [Phytophthora cinnamomi]